MARKINTAVLGAFIAGSLALLVIVILWFSGSDFGAEKTRYLMVFDGSIKGLRVGAPVALKGVDIGQVIDIDVVIYSDTVEVMMPVVVEIDGAKVREIGSAVDQPLVPKLIERGMRAQLRTQSLLTGLLYIQLDFHPDTDISYPEIESDYALIPTIPTDLAELARILATVDLGSILSQTRESLTALNRLLTSDHTQEMPVRLEETLAAVTLLSRDLNKAAPELVRLIGNADGAVNDVRAGLPGVMAGMHTAIGNFDRAARQLDSVLQELDYTLSEDSPVAYEVVNAAQELARAGQALQSLVETIDTRPEVLLRGKRGEGEVK